MTRQWRWRGLAWITVGLLGASNHAMAQERPPAVRVAEPRQADVPPPRLGPAQESSTSLRITTPLRTEVHTTVRQGGVVQSESVASRQGFRANGPGLTETRRCGGGSSVDVGLPVKDCPVVAESVDARALITDGVQRAGSGVSVGLDTTVSRELRYAPDKQTFEAQQVRGPRPGEPAALRTEVGAARIDGSVDVSVRGIDAHVLSSGIGVSTEQTTAARGDVVVPSPSNTVVQSLSTPWGSTSTQVRQSQGQASVTTTVDERGNRSLGPYQSSTRECQGSQCQVVSDEQGVRLKGSMQVPVGVSVEASASVSLGDEYSSGREAYEAQYERTLQRLRDDFRRTGQEGYLGANDARSPYRVQTFSAQIEGDAKLEVGPRVSVDVLGGGASYASKITRSADEDALRAWEAGRPARDLQQAQSRIQFERLQQTNQQAEVQRLEAQSRQAEAAKAAAAAAAATQQRSVKSSQPDAAAQILRGVNAAAQAYVQRRSAPVAAPTQPSGASQRNCGQGVCVVK